MNEPHDRSLFHALTLAALLAVTAGAQGAIIQFTDRAAFIAATGAGAMAPLPITSSAASLSNSDQTFTALAPFNVATLNHHADFSTLIPGPVELTVNGIESFNVDSTTPLQAFGFDFHEPSDPGPPPLPDTCNAPCFDSTFQVTLKMGAIIVGSFNFNRPDDSLQFVGVASTSAFDRIEILEPSQTADNEFFSNFLIDPAAVPEPATWILFGVGLAGLAARRRAGGIRLR